MASLMAKGRSGNPACLPAHTALEMATINGAKALGLDHKNWIIGDWQRGGYDCN